MCEGKTETEEESEQEMRFIHYKRNTVECICTLFNSDLITKGRHNECSLTGWKN